MLNQTECLLKAIDFYQLALLSPPHNLREGYTEMANGWRRAAAMAAWQDRFTEFQLNRIC